MPVVAGAGPFSADSASFRHQQGRVARFAGVAVATLSLLSPAWADEAAAFSELMGHTVTAVTAARAYVDVCDERFPESRLARRDFMAGWAHQVDLADYDRLLAGAAAAYAGLGEDLDIYAASTRSEIAAAIEVDPAPCQDLAEALDEDMFDIAGSIHSLVRDAEDFGINVAEAPALSFDTPDLGLMPLAALWTRALAVMEDVGTKAGAEDNRHLKEAREDYLLQWLQAQGELRVQGRVVGEDELREWRGDWQSSLEVACSDFATQSDEDLMASGLGTDVVVAGRPTWVLELRGGGVINLRDCRLSKAEATDMAAANIDDSAGLMLRPLEFEEAFAGPDAGMAMSEIERVLYLADFTNRIDGFGNGYTDRQEDIYVLRKDGTAYRHHWDFAFTDLDVDRSRQREPERWFTWSDHWGKVTLTPAGVEEREIDLSEARRLVPMPAGQRLDGTFYYLNVGSGGARSDREYVFNADGSVTYTRGGFIAGNFAGSFITVVPGQDDPERLSYRFDNFTMIVEGPDGEERHFLAMVEGDDPAAPEELLIRGQVYWDRDEK